MNNFFSIRNGFKCMPVILTMCMVIYFLVLPSAFADQQARITGSESQLNVLGFSAGNAFSFNFDDTVNLHTGNLIVTTSDVYLPGRNGMDLSITRQYDSNIFLHWNQCPKAGEGLINCGTVNNGERINNLKWWCDNYCPDCYCENLCDNCNPSNFEGCCQYADQEVTSLKSATWLGLGWKFDLGKIKDPTELFVDDNCADTQHLFAFGVPEKGINSMSLVLNNAENQIIVPYYFKSQITPTWAYRAWGSDLMNDENPDDNMYIAYLNDLSPIIFKHDKIFYMDDYLSCPDDQPTIKAGIPFSAEYYKGGARYLFNHYVPFCSDFDDIPYMDNEPGKCIFQEEGTIIYNSKIYQDTYKYYKWTENPYAGLYLTAITDRVGNYIAISYEGWPGTFWNLEDDNPPFYVDDENIYDNSPFITNITDTLGRVIHFCTADPSVVSQPQDCNLVTTPLPTINGRLRWIKYPNYEGTPIYVVYYYTGTKDELLEKVEVWTDDLPPNGENMNLTTRYYYNNPASQYQPYKALRKIEYPTGAYVEYSYHNTFNPSNGLFKTTNFYTYNYIFATPQFEDVPEYAARWAIQTRTVYTESDSATWNYNYISFNEGSQQPLFDVVLTNTTIIDPYGDKEVHTFFPAAHMPIRCSYY